MLVKSKSADATHKKTMHHSSSLCAVQFQVDATGLTLFFPPSDLNQGIYLENVLEKNIDRAQLHNIMITNVFGILRLDFYQKMDFFAF
jgi:hypothetical protein